MKKLLMGLLAAGVLSAQDPTSSTGQALFARVQQAVGGAEKLAEIRDWTQTLVMTAGDVHVKQVIQYTSRDLFRVEQGFPFGLMVTYVDGATGWLATPQGVQDVPAGNLKTMKGQFSRTLPAMLIVRPDEPRTMNAVDDSTVEITNSGESARITFDGATGLPVRMTFRISTEVRAMDMTESYSDWRDVDGVRMPFRIVVEQDGRKVGDATVSEYKINSGLTAQELGRRP